VTTTNILSTLFHPVLWMLRGIKISREFSTARPLYQSKDLFKVTEAKRKKKNNTVKTKHLRFHRSGLGLPLSPGNILETPD
jgi:hypothetical protein